MDSTLPLYRQLTSRFVLLALSFFLLLFTVFSLYFQHQQALTTLKYQQFPAIEKHHQRQLLLIKNDRLISNILDSKNAELFDDDYQTLSENLKNISTLSEYNGYLLEPLMQRLQMQAENVTRLAESARRNLQLKDSVIIQLTLVADSLSNLIAEQTSQQKDLYRQITQDNLTVRVIATKAKALSELVNNLNANRELQSGLIDTLVLFNQLNLQYDLVEFDYIQQKIQSDITHWLANAGNAIVKNAQKEALFEQISVLNALLFSEQNSFAKWRHQLRMASDYQVELAKLKTALIPLLDKKLIIQSLDSSMMEQQLLAWMEKVNVPLDAKYYNWLVVAAFVLLAIIFIWPLLSLRRKVKQFSLQSTAVVAELVTKDELVAKISSRESSATGHHLKPLAQSVVASEDGFQGQQRQWHTDLISRHSGHVFWQLPILSKQKQQQLYALLGVELASLHWRKCFSRADVRAILSLARQAKKYHSVEKIALISNQQQAIMLTIEYLDGAWCGSLCDAEAYRVVKDQNTQLQQQLQQQNQVAKLAIMAGCEDALTMVNKAMVQSQMLSLMKGDENVAYQQLRQLMDWAEQIKTSAQLRRDDFVLTLSTVKLANEMHTALANISLHQTDRENLVYLYLADNLPTWLTLEIDLFQTLIVTVGQKMLTDQLAVELNVDLQVIELNSAQKSVRFSFLINAPSNAEMLSEVLKELAFDDEVCVDFDHTIGNYLRDLQLVFNISNKASQQLERAGRFYFDLPLPLAEDLSQPSTNKPVELAPCALLVIATDKCSGERICHQFTDSKAVVETLQDLSLLQRQLSINTLTKNPLDGIILSPEVYCSDFDLITQHLSTLPIQIQPKLMVIQPFNCDVIHRNGLFSVSNLPWFTGELVASVAELLRAKNKINLLVTPETFSSYRFVASQVEVLLAVAQPSKNGALIRILYWLGLQVTVVSQPESLERLCRSGRYLVVISEFAAVNLDITESLTTVYGIFALTNNDDSKEDFFSKCTLPKSWRSGYLASVQDIEKLIEQLSPWLTSDAGAGEHNNLLSPPQQLDKQDDIISSSMDNEIVVTSAQKLPTADTESSLNTLISLEQANKPVAEVLDIVLYAKNQGSAELAAFMLEEYLADISVNIQALTDALEAQNYRLSVQLLQSLITLAKVLAAAPLLAQCRQLSQLISQKNASDAFLPQQKEELQRQLTDLKQCLVQLTEFAESI